MGKDLEKRINERRKDDSRELYKIKVLNECPLLGDERFTNKYPGIVDVAAFIYEIRDTCSRKGLGEAIPLFEEIGIKNLNEYLELIPKIMNKGTRAHYTAIKFMLSQFYT